jgi:hypothetical protein
MFRQGGIALRPPAFAVGCTNMHVPVRQCRVLSVENLADYTLTCALLISASEVILRLHTAVGVSQIILVCIIATEIVKFYPAAAYEQSSPFPTNIVRLSVLLLNFIGC